MSSSDEQIEPTAPPQTNSSQPMTRACDLCRAMKVRCIPDMSKKGTCQRCANTNRECIFKPIKTRRKKRTDTRINELEREVQAMRALLERKAALPIPESKTSSHSGSTRSGASPTTADRTLSKTRPESWDDVFSFQEVHEASGTSPANPTKLIPPYATDEVFVCTEDDLVKPLAVQLSTQELKDLDIIERGVLSIDTAKLLLETYINDIMMLSPFVLVSKDTSVNELRREKPTLFLSIMAAAAGKHDPKLYKVLNSEIRQVYATSLLGGKSLELVQAMMITAVWYYPPSSCRQVKYYEYIHMAATMALDIGIGTKPRKNGVGPSWEISGVVTDHYAKTQPLSEDSELENRRTFLSCYIMCSDVAVSTRRPSMLRFNNWLADCVQFLQKSPRAAPSDKFIVAWVQLLRLCEEITTSFGYDSDVVSLVEPRVQLMLRSFEKRLEMWIRDLDPELQSDTLKMVYHKTVIYLHELGIHDDHPPEDFKPPWNIEMIDPMRIRLEPSGAEIDAAMACISSAHSLLEVFLGMSTDAIRSMPTHSFFAHVVYAVVVLMKLDISASDPASKLGQFVDRDTLKVKWYLEAVIRNLRDAVGCEGFRVPSNFLGLLMKFMNNHVSNYRLWTGIANDDHHYDVKTGKMLTASEESMPEVSEAAFSGPSVNAIENALAFDMQLDFDASMLGDYNETTAYNNDAIWAGQQLDFMSSNNNMAQTYNWT